MKSETFKTTFLSLFLFASLSLGGVVHAEDFKSINSLNIDTTISTKSDSGFSNPTKILITPINLESRKISFEKWVKGVYYYTINKLGFQDIPYHYLVSENGDILVGNSSGDEKEINIEELGVNNIIIGYFNSSGNNFISPEAESTLERLLLDISNRNGINPQNIYVSGTQFVKEKTSNTITIHTKKITGNWDQNVSKMISTIRGSYSPVAKSYSAEVSEVTSPTDEVNPGDEISISVKLKNIGSFGFYQDSTSEIILTKEGSASSFYINNTWLSQTQTSIMPENQALLPETERVFEFKVKAPLANGSYAENFILKTASGAAIKLNKIIEVKINLKKSDKQIIEIKPTGAGFINVRKSPNDASVVMKVTPGQRFFLIDVNQDTLWAEIDLGGGTTGYIAAWQFSYL